MAIRVACSCGRVVDWPDDAAGRARRCPFCGSAMAVPAMAGGSPPPMCPPPIPPAGGAPPPAAPPRRGMGLAVASMVLGILSCLSCGVSACLLGAPGLVLGLLAVVFGIVGLRKNRPGRGFSITGLVTGMVGCLLGLLPMGLVGAARGLSWLVPTPTAAPPTAGVRKRPPAPPALTTSQIVEALTGPLTPPPRPDARRAAAELQKAVALYARRGDDPIVLYECVQCFRRHLALAGLDEPADPARREMFATARDELAGAVLEAYEAAGEHQRARRWEQAVAAWGKLRSLVPDGSNPVRRSAEQQAAWCRRRRHAEAENDAGMPR